MENPICCNPKVDTFLLKPQYVEGIEKPRLTVKEQEENEKRLVERLDYPVLWDIFDDKTTIDEKMEKVNKYLEYLYKKEELLAKDKEKKEDYEKLEREIKYFLEQKKSLIWEYQQKLPTMLEEALNIPYPEDFWENIRKDLEEKRIGR